MAIYPENRRINWSSGLGLFKRRKILCLNPPSSPLTTFLLYIFKYFFIILFFFRLFFYYNKDCKEGIWANNHDVCILIWILIHQSLSISEVSQSVTYINAKEESSMVVAKVKSEMLTFACHIQLGYESFHMFMVNSLPITNQYFILF